MRTLLQPIPTVSIGQTITHRAIQSIDILAAGLTDLNGIVHAQVQRNPFLKIKPGNKHHAVNSYGHTDQNIIESVAQPVGLVQHLSLQLAIFKLDANIRAYVDAIINSLDEAGYLRISLDELAAVTELPVQQLEHALMLVQSLEPAGIGARSLVECFTLQLDVQNNLTNDLRVLLKNIEKINTMPQDKLASLCGVDVDRLVEMIGLLRNLNPYPGRQFTEETSVYVIPDIILVKNTDSSLSVQINNDDKPQVYFDRKYFDQVYAQISQQPDKDFLQRCYSDAHNLINDLSQRDSSISRVANHIVSKQQLYFKGLGSQLQPITQRDIAHSLNLHESTVSRTVANKYISYQGKTVALQEYCGNTAAVSDSISVQIQELIQHETIDTILSDEDITQLLKQSGITVARRTVAKYRSELNIPASSQRRKEWVRYV